MPIATVHQLSELGILWYGVIVLSIEKAGVEWQLSYCTALGQILQCYRVCTGVEKSSVCEDATKHQNNIKRETLNGLLTLDFT
jgi:hypothetical protein